MRTPVLLASWLVAMAVMAGCLQGDEATPTADERGEGGPVEFTEDTGAVSDQVLDDQSLPVNGTEVGLRGDAYSETTTTDEAGVFGFSNVPPGAYELLAQRLGYEAVGQRVDVVAGKVTEVTIDLVRIPGQTPHHTTLQAEGVIQCSTRAYPGAPLAGVIDPGWYTGVAVCGVPGAVGLPPPPVGDPDKFLLLWAIPEADVNQFYLEMEWQSTQALGKGLSVSMEYNGTANVEGIPPLGTATGESPLTVLANQSIIWEVANATAESDADVPVQNCVEEPCTLYTRVFAEANTTNLDWPTDPPDVPVVGPPPDRMADVGLAFNQRFTQYLTSFHFQEKPDEFTARPDF